MGQILLRTVTFEEVKLIQDTVIAKETMAVIAGLYYHSKVGSKVKVKT